MTTASVFTSFINTTRRLIYNRHMDIAQSKSMCVSVCVFWTAHNRS